MELTIAEKKLCIKEYAGQRVVTFADIDTVHQRAVGTASRNFRENRKRFIEGTDYFVLIGDALRDYKQATNFVGRKINELHLITETATLCWSNPLRMIWLGRYKENWSTIISVPEWRKRKSRKGDRW